MDRKTKIISFFGVLVVIFFAYSVVSVFNEKSNKEIAKLEEVNANAKAEAAAAKKRSDSAAIVAAKMRKDIARMEGCLIEQNQILYKFQKSYDKSLIELNKYKNEKNYIPDNATTAQQSDFLSSYKYEAY